MTVGDLAAGEALRPAAAAYPAEMQVDRTVSAQVLVSFAGNQYLVPPGLSGGLWFTSLACPSGSTDRHLRGGATVAVHNRHLDGAGATLRDDGHVVALERAVLASFTSSAVHA